jgi:hypothetical protein
MSIQHRSNLPQGGSVQIPPSPVHAKGTAMKLNRSAVLLSTLLASTATAQVITETNTTLFPTPEQAIQRDFGLDVAAYGPLHIAVGAPVVGAGPRVGRVFVYEAIFGGLVHEIVPPEGAENPFFFGAQIEISGDTLVVSTSRQTGVNFIAEVYVYDLVTGDFLFELAPINPLNNELSFGYDIAIEDNIIAVGQPDYDSLKGCVYLYDATDGSLIDVIFGDTFFPNVDFPRFGDQVVLSNGKLAVSHQELALAEPVTPSVFIFDAGTSALLNQAFPTPEIVSDDRWGDAIAMNDDTLIVCAPGDDPFGEDSGSAFAYDTSTGAYRTRLDLMNITPAGATQPMFMDAEINDNGLVAIYSSGRESGQLGDGSVDLLDSITGSQVGTLEPFNGQWSASFGGAIAFNGSMLYVSDIFSALGEVDRVYQFSTGATITLQPQSFVLDEPAIATMQVAAPNGVDYQWFKDDELIENGPNFDGVTTNTLNITAGPETEGAYTCRVTSEATSDVFSEPGYLVYQGASAPACQADFNDDGLLNFFDVSLFIQAYTAGCP